MRMKNCILKMNCSLKCVKFISEDSCLQQCCGNLKSRKFISFDIERDCPMISLSVTPPSRRSCQPFTVYSTYDLYCMKLVFLENSLRVLKPKQCDLD
jgi:hypothetical protein